MGGVTTVRGKGFYQQDLVEDGTKSGGTLQRSGVHLDVCHKINNFTITASLTDSTFKDLEDFPTLRDGLLTFEMQEGSTDFLLGYDAGSKNLFAGAHHRFEIDNKPVRVGGTWFNKGNHVVLEGTLNLDALSQYPRLWATHTLNSAADIANSTRVNLAERQDFAILPFTPHLASTAVGLEYSWKEAVLHAAYDVKQEKPFIGASGFFKLFKDDEDKSLSVKFDYSPKDEYGMITIGKHQFGDDKPFIKAYIRARIGEQGIDDVSSCVGMSVNKDFDF
eukprot:jgi/Botrbrau1/12649/Bobra.67_1s0015.1